jgi:hypothetical protein
MKEGDYVTWTQMKLSGSSMNIRSLEGQIVRIEGDKAVVRRNRKLTTISLAHLRLASDRSELTEMILGKKPEGG